MSDEDLMQRVGQSFETPTSPGLANGTSEAVVVNDLPSGVTFWLGSECVSMSHLSSNARILWREFRNWSGLECTQDEFSANLEHRGFVVDRGMVEGLALNEDLLAAVEYERERLRSKKVVQLDLFNPETQDYLAS